MTLTHLPTRLSELVNQPFGFVSSAEGFVFLSAMLVATLYIHQAEEDSGGVRTKLWKRALRIYGYHLIMLAMVFTVVAAFAAHTHRAAIYNLLNFYLAHPATAIIGSLLLIYCPPLLDILPMYVTFLLLTPYILNVAVRRGLERHSAGQRYRLAAGSVRFAHLDAYPGGACYRAYKYRCRKPERLTFLPGRPSGSWPCGWGLSRRRAENPLGKLPVYVFPLSVAICLFFLGVRHDWLGPHLTQEALGLSLDKWQIGPLRMLNLFAFSCVVYWSRKYLTKLVLVEPFLTLGKASLEVFCAHLFFVFVGLALLYGEVTELHGPYALILLTITFTALILVAIREVRRKQKARLSPPVGATAKESFRPVSGLNPPPAESRAEV